MVSKLVRENLTRRAARFNLILDDVSITHVTFSPAFSDAVEAKQIAQQTAQRAAYLVDQVPCPFLRSLLVVVASTYQDVQTGHSRKTIHHRPSPGRSSFS